MTATTHFVPAGWGNPERTNRKTEGQIDGDKNTTKAKPIIDLEAELKRLNLSITELAMDNFKLRVEIRELKEQNEVLTKGLEELRKTVEKLKPRQHNESRGLFPVSKKVYWI